MLSPKPTKRPPMSTSTSSHASLSPTAATPTASSTSLAPKHTAPSQPEEDRTKTFIEWYCKDCDKACVHIRSENRCLCGHRFKEHKQGHGSKGWKCSSHKCPCDGFFYVFGQGALVLKCRCKHKHIEHDSSKKPYKCVKSGCKCSAFDSPWQCNCNCGWIRHEQRYKEVSLSEVREKLASVDIYMDVGNPFAVQRGLDN